MTTIAIKGGSMRRILGIALAAALLALAAGSAGASAEVSCGACAPWWHIDSGSVPANLAPGGEGKISLLAQDLGDASANAQIVVSDKLPPGLTAQGAELHLPEVNGDLGFFCAVAPGEVTCTLPQVLAELVSAYGSIEIYIDVKVAAGAKTGEVNSASVSGGGAPNASVSTPIAVSGEPFGFGVERYELRAENADGSPDTQAGSHPFQLTTGIALKQGADMAVPPEAVKDLRFNLPPGLIGNPTPFPQCPLAKFTANAQSGQNFCPNNTVVGVASVTIVAIEGLPLQTKDVPLFALVPSVGEPARFGFDVLGDPVYLNTSVRTGGDYGVTVTVPNITEAVSFISSRVTFWGVPGDARHDASRGWNCIEPGVNGLPPCAAVGQESPPPLLTMPTACGGPVHTNVETDSWEQAGAFHPPFQYTFLDNLGRPSGMDGCNRLPFTPSVKVTPDGQAGSTPTGLTVDEHVPQESDLNPTGLSESAVKGLSVTLPEGVALNPSAADGLQACSQEQIGLQVNALPGCPEASKVATVEIKTPLLANPLEGAAYLAAQDANPFGSLVAMYVYAEDPISGVRAKAAGEVLEDPVTGQLTAHFEKDPVFADDPRYAGEPEAQFLPEVPFEDVELHFFGGDRAPLATPARVRLVHDDGDVHAVVGRGEHRIFLVLRRRSPARTGRPCHDPSAVRAVVDGRYDEHPGGRVQPVHDDDEPRGRSAEPELDQAEDAPGAVGHALARRSCAANRRPMRGRVARKA